MATTNATSLRIESIACYATLRAFVFVIASQPSVASAAQYSVVRTFAFGSDASSLGFERGDTGDTTASLTSVDANGTAYIYDYLNERIVSVRGDGTPGPVVESAVDSLSIGEGRFAANLHGTVLRIYDASAAVMAEKIGIYYELLGKTSQDTLLVANSGGPVVELDTSLAEVARYKNRDDVFGSQITVGASKVLRWHKTCWVAPKDVGVGAHRILRADGSLRFVGSGYFAEVSVDSLTSVWKIPENKYLAPVPPPGILNPGLWAAASTTVVWKQVSLVTGDSGEFYGFVQTPDHYELIRWNLDELPKTVFPPPANQPPVIESVTPQRVKAGIELKTLIGVRDPEGRNLFTLTAEGVSKGAQFVPRYGMGKAALVWTPAQTDVGQYTVTIRAEDDICAESSGSFQITVEP